MSPPGDSSFTWVESRVGDQGQSGSYRAMETSRALLPRASLYSRLVSGVLTDQGVNHHEQSEPWRTATGVIMWPAEQMRHLERLLECGVWRDPCLSDNITPECVSECYLNCVYEAKYEKYTGGKCQAEI